MLYRPKRPLPESSSTPREIVAARIESYEVGSWCPTPDGSGPAEAVAINFNIQGLEFPLILRMKTPAAVDEMIDALRRHKMDVWPGEG